VTGIPSAVVGEPGLVVTERGAVFADPDVTFEIAVVGTTVVGL